MKHDLIKRIAAGAMSLCLCLSLAPIAGADGGFGTDAEFERLVAELCGEYDAAAEDVYAGYMNLATGEERYYQGDDYVIAGSMYKVPLCMVFAQRIANGELNWDEHYPNLSFDDARNAALIYSDNDMAGFLWGELGSFTDFRRICAPYMGVDPDSVDPAYYDNNLFTSRQMISCLKTLYDGGDEFPEIIDTMKQADQDRFFRYSEDRYDVAQKYGYCHDDADVSAYLNCCGVVYADDPIAIVMFTKDVFRSEELLGAYCTAMCDYTAQSKAARLEAGSEVAEALTQEQFSPLSTAQAAAPVETAAVSEMTQSAETGRREVSSLIAVVLIVLLAAASLLALSLRRKKYNIKSFWLVVTVTLAASAMLLGVIGMSTGTLYAKPNGDPQDAVADFFDAVKTADYDRAYERLRDYSALGLEALPESEAGQIVCAALRQSYDYELMGQCQVDKLTGVQRVTLRYLDLTGIKDDLKTETMDELEKIVQSRKHSAVYDSNDQYLPEVANEAYISAVRSVMADAEKYYAETEFDLVLTYADDRWQIETNPVMLKALNGGAGY